VAEVVFLPYNYLLDKAARKAQGVDVNNAIIIFDEAHNVESSCGDATSFEISTTDLKRAVQEVEYCFKSIDSLSDFGAEEYSAFADKLCAFITLLQEQPISRSTKDLIKPADYIFTIFACIGISHLNADHFRKLADECIKTLSAGNIRITVAKEFGRSRNRMSLSIFQDAMKIAFHIGQDDQATLKSYKVHVQAREAVVTERGMPANVTETVLSFWCFSAGVAMQELISDGARTIILASGTLVA
jgi:regulator of telomere elongation helicase 1